MELYISSCGKYKIEILKPETFPGAMAIMRDAYIPDEYVCKANEIIKDPEAVEQFIGFCADAILDSISVVAVEIETGDVVAVCVNKLQIAGEGIQAKISDDSKLELRPATESMVKFALEMEHRINLFEIYKVDCSFELLFLGTHPAHREKKLGYLCCKASVDVAKKLKDGPVSKITAQDFGPDYLELKPREPTKVVPKMCQMTCSSIATQKIGKALGFTVHLRLSFTEFSYDGMTYVERNGFDPYVELQGFQLD